jgi:large subunit ribosomal protein L3
MSTPHHPRCGSKAFYPKVRAKKETPSFSSFPALEGEESKPLNFLSYKVGMLHALATNEAEKTKAFGQEVFIPCTVLETPPLNVFGVRADKKTPYGVKTVSEVLTEKVDKHLGKRIKFVSKKSKKEKVKKTIDDLGKDLEKIDFFRLLVHTNPSLTGFGKKKPEVSEIALSGSKDKQFEFAKVKLGQKISINDVFERGAFLDVRGVDKGKGFQGPVKRAGVKIHRPKAKKHRTVGSISPWNPSTIMWTVARPGQLGYQNRTEFNKRILKLDSQPEAINPSGGFTNYGVIKNDYMVLAGSVPGPAKRCIALRHPVRSTNEKKWKVGDFSFVSTLDVKNNRQFQKVKKAEKKEEKKEVKAEKVEEKKEVKKEEKKEAPKEVKKEAPKEVKAVKEAPKEVKAEVKEEKKEVKAEEKK